MKIVIGNGNWLWIDGKEIAFWEWLVSSSKNLSAMVKDKAHNISISVLSHNWPQGRQSNLLVQFISKLLQKSGSKTNVNFWQHTAIRQTHRYIMDVNNFIFSIIFIELIEYITRWKKSSEISVILMDSYSASNCSYGDIFWRNRQCYNTFFNNQYSYNWCSLICQN